MMLGCVDGIFLDCPYFESQVVELRRITGLREI
jgi:hypothetical protein